MKRNLQKCLGNREKFIFPGIGAFKAVNGREVEGWMQFHRLLSLNTKFIW